MPTSSSFKKGYHSFSRDEALWNASVQQPSRARQSCARQSHAHTHTHGDFCSVEQHSDNFVKTFSMTIRITNLSKCWAATDARSERDVT